MELKTVKLPKICFSDTEHNLSRIRLSEHNFEQKKRLLRALLAGRISHFKSRIYPSLAKDRKLAVMLEKMQLWLH